MQYMSIATVYIYMNKHSLGNSWNVDGLDSKCVLSTIMIESRRNDR